MNTTITSFTNEYIRIGRGFVSSTISVVNAYVAYNNGSTSGKLKLYAYLQSLEGVSKVRSEFYGIQLAEPTPAVQEIKQPEQEPVLHIENETKKEPTLSEYERLCIELKNKKIEQARLMEEKRIAQDLKDKEHARMMEEKRVAQDEKKIALKEKKLRQEHDIEMMKLQFKSNCFIQTMDFQKEVNNMNRYMSAGFVNRKTEYVVLGTASNVHIEYDSAIDNLNELEYKDDIKNPIEKCFNDKTVELKMVDETVEKAISLKSMINIHEMIISKLDTNEISQDIKNRIMDEYDNVCSIVDDLDVSDDHAKQYIKISNSEIRRLKDIETEARLYARVHTSSYKRCLEENTKMNDKLGRKSMLPVMDYIVSENNIRSGSNQSILIDCYCCSKEVSIKDAHRSHILAKELGGSCDKENIRVCCKECNLDMGIMDLELYKSSKCSL